MSKKRKENGLLTHQGLVVQDLNGDGWDPNWFPTFAPLNSPQRQNQIVYDESPNALLVRRREVARQMREVLALAKTKYRKALSQWRVKFRLWKDQCRRRLIADVESKRVKYRCAEVQLSRKFTSGHHPMAGWALSTMAYRQGELVRKTLENEVALNPNNIRVWLSVGRYNLTDFDEGRERIEIGEYPILAAEDGRKIVPGFSWSNVQRIVGSVRYYYRIRRLTAKEAKQIVRGIKRRWGKLQYEHLLRQQIPQGLVRPDRDTVTSAEMLKLRDLREELNSLIQFQRCTHIQRIPAGDVPVHGIMTLKGCNPSSAIPCLQLRYGDAYAQNIWSQVDMVAIPNLSSPFWGENGRGLSPSGVESVFPLSDLLAGNELNYQSIPVSHDWWLADKTWSLPDGEASIQMRDPARENYIVTDTARRAAKLEGLIFGSESVDRASRSIAELKDTKQTFAEVPGFLAFLIGAGSTGTDGARIYRKDKLLMTVRTVREAAKAYLWYKFGIEPVTHDINVLLEDFRCFLAPCRAGLRRMYAQWFILTQPFTFKNKRKWQSPNGEQFRARSAVDAEPLDTEVVLPILCLDSLDLSSFEFGKFTSQKGGVLLPTDEIVPNGLFFLGGLGIGSPGQSVDYSDFADRLIDLVRSAGAPRSFEWYTTETQVFSRFSAEEVRKAVNGAEDLLTSLYDVGHPFSTSWELMPLSFLADWFVSTREVIDMLEKKAFLLREGLDLKSLYGPWATQRIIADEWVSGLDVDVVTARVGCASVLRSEGYPVPAWADGATWGGKTSWMTKSLGEVWSSQRPLPYVDFTSHPERYTWLRRHADFIGLKYPYEFNHADAFHLPLLYLRLRAKPRAIEYRRSTTRIFRRFPLEPGFTGLGYIPTYRAKLGGGKMASLAALLTAALPVHKSSRSIRYGTVPGMPTIQGRPWKRFVAARTKFL